MRTLEVWLYDTLVGRIAENRKGGRFEYTQDMLQAFPGNPLLSLSMPVKKRPFGEAKTANWFEGLLPEGERRDAICRRLGLSPYDWIGLLAEIGWECAGAVRVFDEGGRKAHPGSYERIDEEELAVKLGDLFTSQPVARGDVFRMSLDGYQDKICVAMPDIEEGASHVSPHEVAIPCGDAPSTHILKPESSAYPGLAESEAWAMTVARHAARCAKVALLDLQEAPATLVVERYDRTGEGWPRGVARLHQEDACQALGLPPSRKYASPSDLGDDPSYKKIADLLMRFANEPEDEMCELLRQAVVNYTLGNWDAHAKNISLLYEKKALPTLAPLYDVVPIAEVEPRTTQLSLRIGGSLAPCCVTKSLLIAEVESWGLGRAVAHEVIGKCVNDIEIGVEAARQRYPLAAKRHEKPALRRLEKIL